MTDAAGALWIGVDAAARRMAPDGADGLIGAQVVDAGAPVRALAIDGGGALWMGTVGGGAARWHRDRLRRLTRADGLADDTVTAILPVADEAVFLGHPTGTTRWSPDGARAWGAAEGHPAGAVRALHRDAAGALWIGTYGGGLGRLRGDRVDTLTRDTGLLDDVVSAIVVDADVVWMSGNGGVFAARRADLDAALDSPGWRAPMVAYPTGEANGIGRPSAWVAPDGRLWFATVDGVVRLDPRARRRSAMPPTPIIEHAALGATALALDGSTEVAPGAGELFVAFTAADLRRPELLRFEYRLAGGHWTPAGDQRVVRIHNLPPGRHRFEVRTVDGAGRPSDTLASLSFRLRPTWHQVPAVRLLLALALVALGGALGAARVVGLKRRARDGRRDRAAEARRGGAGGRARAAPAAAGPAGSRAPAGGHRAARRRGRARLQQPADGDDQLHPAAGDGSRAAAGQRRRGVPAGHRRLHAEGGRADRPALDLRAPAAPRPPHLRPR